jgi:hypothetical protein
MKILSIALLVTLLPLARAQTTPDQAALLARTRALYDTPFSHQLASLNCAVDFDWRQHLTEALGPLSDNAAPTLNTLQTIHTRILVDAQGASVSKPDPPPALNPQLHEPELQHAMETIVTSGLNAWLPFSRGAIFPMDTTAYHFENIDGGYKLDMTGPNVSANLLLDKDLHLTSGVSEAPQHMRFDTQFTTGPHGLLLAAVHTGQTSSPDEAGESASRYTYQDVQGFQLPLTIDVTAAPKEHWHFQLSDCKVARTPAQNTNPS